MLLLNADRNFYKQMLIIAVPVTLQNFIVSFLNMIDTVMVGRLGETEIAAVGIANQYFFLFAVLLIGLSAGCNVFIAQFWGIKDKTNIQRIIGIGLGSALIISLVFIFFGLLYPDKIMLLFSDDALVIQLGIDYLRIALISYPFIAITLVYSYSSRSIGRALQPMIISAFALIVNAFFNYLLIFGKFGAPVLGVRGAAIATVIARVMEMCCLLIWVYGSKSVLAATFRELTDFSLKFVKRAYHTILPVILNDLCWGLASFVYMVVYGRMGTQAVATVQICNTINNLFLVVVCGLSSAAAVMVGNSIGAGDQIKGKNYARNFALLSIMVGFGLGGLLAISTPLILSFFTVSSSVKKAAQIISYIIAFTFVIRVLNHVLIVGVLRGGGDAKYSLLIEAFTMWIIGVPLTIMGAFLFQLPVYMVYGLAIVEEICKCILCVSRLKSGAWVKNLTRSLAGKISDQTCPYLQ